MSTRKTRDWIALTAAALAMLWFYAWMPAAYHQHWLIDRPEGFYNELADAFLSGQASLLRTPDPRMAALPDPYDPAQNAAYRVNDLSYFKGRYYLYMGPAPAVTVFMPVKLLTGHYLTEKAACALLCTLGAVASLALLMGLCRSCLAGTPATVLVSAAVALVLADGYYAAARGAIAQQVTIANGYAFAMLALWACSRAVISARRALAWLVLASLCLGIAIASRPNYVFASLALLPPFFLWMRANEVRLAAAIRHGLAAAMPLCACVGALLTYNEVRFGHFLEFGQRYQLGGWDQLKLSSSGLGHGWENAWRYLLAPANYSTYFPFVTAPTWIAVSVLRHVPWLWLMPVACWAFIKRGTPAPVRALGASALILAITNLVTLIFLPSGNPAAVLTSANARYLLDFQPALTLFVSLGVVAAFQQAGSSSRHSLLSWTPWVAILSAASVVVALSLDIGTMPSESYRGLASALNLPGYALELARGQHYGPLRLELSLPPGKTGAYEPLVSTGTATSSDLLFVQYPSATQVTFGFVSTDGRGPVTAPITVDYGEPHHLDISMGSLFPPDGHPAWRGVTGPQEAYLRRRLLLKLDGRTVVDAPAHFESAKPDHVSVGGTPILRGYSSLAFTGVIHSSQRLAISSSSSDVTPVAQYGPVEMGVLFPAHPVEGVREPLVTTGVPRAGDIVYVQYLAGDRVAFGIDHWGTISVPTQPVSVVPGERHTIGISIGSLFPAEEHGSRRQHARIVLDGLTVFDGEQDTYDSSPYDVTVGTNAIGGSTCGYAFTGRIDSLRRQAPGR